MDKLFILFLPLLGMLRFAPPIRPGSSAEPGPASGDGFLLENGTDFYLMESGDFLLLE
jgi:hypothetical protein